MTRSPITKSNFQDIVEMRIREAKQNGSFDNLPFKGEPLPNLDQAYDENWWIKSKLKNERVQTAPEPIRVRAKTERWLEVYLSLPSEMMVRNQASALNDEITKTNNGPLGPLRPQRLLNVDALVQTWRQQR